MKWYENNLTKVFKVFGEERYSKKIAREIIKKPTPPKQVTKTTVKPKPPVVKPKTKPKIGTRTPAQDKVKRLQAAQRKGADTGPSQKDLDKAKDFVRSRRGGTPGGPDLSPGMFPDD